MTSSITIVRGCLSFESRQSRQHSLAVVIAAKSWLLLSCSCYAITSEQYSSAYAYVKLSTLFFNFMKWLDFMVSQVLTLFSLPVMDGVLIELKWLASWLYKLFLHCVNLSFTTGFSTPLCGANSIGKESLNRRQQSNQYVRIYG